MRCEGEELLTSLRELGQRTQMYVACWLLLFGSTHILQANQTSDFVQIWPIRCHSKNIDPIYDSPMPNVPGDWTEASEGQLDTTRKSSRSCVARWFRKPGAFLEWLVNRIKYTGRRRNLSNGALLNGDVDLAENEALTAHDTPTTTHPLDSEHPLLKLPQEVREMIYLHVFQDAISTATLNGILKQYRMLPPALHEVCRQLRRELRNHSCKRFQDYLHHPDRTSDFWTNPDRIDWRDQDTPIHWTIAFPTPSSNRHKRVLYHARVKPYNCEVQVYSLL